MTRPTKHLGLLVSSALAFAAMMASAAWAGDRYGSAEPQGGDYAPSGYGYQSQYRQGGDDVEQVDPCAMQHHLIGRGCESDRGVSDRETRRYSREEGEDVREVDPCAMQYHVI